MATVYPTEVGSAPKKKAVAVAKSKPKGPGYARVDLNPGLRKGDQQLTAYLAKQYGPILTDKQIGAQAASAVKAQIDPVLAEISRSNQAATRGGADAIKGYTDVYLGDLKHNADQVRSDTAAASADDARAAAALSQFLGGQGAAGGDQLAGKLGQIGAPEAAVADVAGGARAMGAGIAAEGAGRGFTQQSHTIAEGAGQQRYADTLPAIGALAGSQELRDFLTGQAAALKDQTGQLTSQVPGLVSTTGASLRSGRDSQRQARAGALSTFLGGALDRNTQAEIAKYGLQKDIYGIDTNAATDQAVADTRAAAAATKAAAKTKDKHASDHAKALTNLSNAKVDAGQAIVKLATTLQKPHYVERLVTKSKFAPPIKVKVPVPVPGYNEILRRAMALPEITVLGTRYGVKPAVLHQLVAEALTAAGLHPPAGPRQMPPGNENPARTPIG